MTLHKQSRKTGHKTSVATTPGKSKAPERQAGRRWIYVVHYEDQDTRGNVTSAYASLREAKRACLESQQGAAPKTSLGEWIRNEGVRASWLNQATDEETYWTVTRVALNTSMTLEAQLRALAGEGGLWIGSRMTDSGPEVVCASFDPEDAKAQLHTIGWKFRDSIWHSGDQMAAVHTVYVSERLQQALDADGKAAQN